MKTNEYIRKQLNDALNLLGMVVADVPAELMNAAQPGTANAIGATIAHALLAVDVMVNVALADGAPALFTSGAAQQLGIAEPNPRNWPALKQGTFGLAALQHYADAVRGSVNAYTDKLAEKELDRAFNFFGTDTTVADTLILATTEILEHAGEIAAVKGTHGLKGLPF